MSVFHRLARPPCPFYVHERTFQFFLFFSRFTDVVEYYIIRGGFFFHRYNAQYLPFIQSSINVYSYVR